MLKHRQQNLDEGGGSARLGADILHVAEELGGLDEVEERSGGGRSGEREGLLGGEGDEDEGRAEGG